MSLHLTEVKAQELWEAQEKAEALFGEIGRKGLTRPRMKKQAVNEEIYALAEQMFGIRIYWHGHGSDSVRYSGGTWRRKRHPDAKSCTSPASE